MSRAFLITHRKYKFEGVEEAMSPEHSVSLAEIAENSSTECPDELYNLTKLAEVAVASRRENHPQNDDTNFSTYTHKLFDKSSRIQRPHLVPPISVPIPSPISTPPHQQEQTSSTENNSLSSLSSESNDSTMLDKNSNDSSDGSVATIDGNDTHECTDCGKKYSTSSNLARHRQTHRSPGDKKARRCPHCDKLYVSMPAFSMHVRTHNQGCKCQYCGKCFSRPWLLQGHIRTHTGEKPFKCQICNKAFADKSNLRAHVQTHSNTKPHICVRCGKAFALKSYLYKHEESSCMRVNARRPSSVSSSSISSSSSSSSSSSLSREATPEKQQPATTSTSSPTPVIVIGGGAGIGSGSGGGNLRLPSSDSGIIKTPVMYRSTVISSNPERVLYSTVQHPTVILGGNTGQRFNNLLQTQQQQQDQPMDFSARREFGRQSDRPGYIGFAISV